MTDNNSPPPATPRPEEKPKRVFTVRDEIRDKLSVYASADKHPHRLQREIIQQQCEDFLVEMFEGAPSAPEEPKSEAVRSASPQHDDVETDVLTIRVFREDDGRFAAEYRRDEDREGGMGRYSGTPIGALAELIATLIKVDEDNAMERVTRFDSDVRVKMQPETVQVVRPVVKVVPAVPVFRDVDAVDSEQLRAGMDDVVSAGSPSDLARIAELESEITTLRSTHATLQSALRDLQLENEELRGRAPLQEPEAGRGSHPLTPITKGIFE